MIKFARKLYFVKITNLQNASRFVGFDAMIDGLRQTAQNKTDLAMIYVGICDFYRLYEKGVDILMNLKYNNK